MFDRLEARRLFSIAIVNKVLTITGSGGIDTIYAAWNNAGTSSTVRVNDGTTSQVFTLASGSFTSVSLYGGAGGDTVFGRRIMSGYNSYTTLLPVTANGGTGGDTVYGSDSKDTLLGGSGDDELYGYGGDDSLKGEGGNDDLDGGDGNDTIEAWLDSGVDNVIGGAGADYMSVDRGFDPAGSYYYQIDTYPDYDLVEGDVVAFSF